MKKLALPVLQPRSTPARGSRRDRDRHSSIRSHSSRVGAGRLRTLAAVTSVAGTLISLTFARPAFAQGPFADVPPNHWAYEAINELASRGILKGFPDGTFRGQQVVTRSEFAVASHRALQNIQQQLAGPKLPPIPPTTPQQQGSQPPAAPRAGTAATQQEVDRLRADLDQLHRLMEQIRETMTTLRTEVDQLRQQLGTMRDQHPGTRSQSQPTGQPSPPTLRQPR